jgi:hypothetical protein
MIVGHPKLTKQAYDESSKDVRASAARFSEATIENALQQFKHELTHHQITAIKAQVERDYLVSIWSFSPQEQK